MSALGKLDDLVEKGAARLESLAREAAARGGTAGNFADELAEDAAFLRRLKPSLMVARARGELPTDEEPGTEVKPALGAQAGERPKPNGGGPNPLAVVAGALAAGIALAKIIDWRGHAHPRH